MIISGDNMRIFRILVLLCLSGCASNSMLIGSQLELMSEINREANKKIIYTSDIENYNLVDYWATPEETISSGKGDCDDYAILKYFNALASGVDENSLSLAYVLHDETEAHLVLEYYDNNEDPYIFDNLTDEVLRLSKRKDLVKYFSIRGDKLIIKGKVVYGRPPKVYQDMLERLKK